MLHRQKALLALLRQADRPLNRITLVKLAFLLRHETSVRQDRTFYDFLPHRFGPFSFALYREMNALERDGYVCSTSQTFFISPDHPELAEDKVNEIPVKRRKEIQEIWTKYGRLNRQSLLKKVYKEYPWYSIRSELTDLIPKSAPSTSNPPISVYTVGYEGKSVDLFFNGLVKYGIEAIIDVRANPISRKYGLAKKSMNSIAGSMGIKYFHIPELGIDSSHRSELSDFDSYQRLMKVYEEKILPKKTEYLNKVIDILKTQPSAFLCVEKDVRCCHRGRLAEAASLASGLPVVHLS